MRILTYILVTLRDLLPVIQYNFFSWTGGNILGEA